MISVKLVQPLDWTKEMGGSWMIESTRAFRVYFCDRGVQEVFFGVDWDVCERRVSDTTCIILVATSLLASLATYEEVCQYRRQCIYSLTFEINWPSKSGSSINSRSSSSNVGTRLRTP